MARTARKKLIIEARINEYMMRDDNPNVPWTPDEIAEAAAGARQAGASIVHYHARNAYGSPCHDAGIYSETIRKIRGACDVLVHPTLGQVTIKGDEARLRHIVDAVGDPALKPDIAPIDIGSTNVDVYDAPTKAYRTDDLAYVNTIGTLRFFAERLRALGVKPVIVSWTIPFTRTLEAFLDMGLVDEPVYLLFALSDSGYLGGHPGTVRGLMGAPGLPAQEPAHRMVGQQQGRQPVRPGGGGHRDGRPRGRRARGLCVHGTGRSDQRRRGPRGRAAGQGHGPRGGDARRHPRDARHGVRAVGAALRDPSRYSAACARSPAGCSSRSICRKIWRARRSALSGLRKSSE